MKRIKYIFSIFILILLSACTNETLQLDGGTYEGETENGQPSGYGEWKNSKKHISYDGFWANGKKNGTGTLRYGKLCYKGEFINNKFSGYGEVSRGDSVIYSGEWKDGLRYGKGISYSIKNKKIFGLWSADTLISGIKIGRHGIYSGQLNQQGLAEGHGTYTGNNGKYYEGHWTNDKQNTLGFAITSNNKLRAGEWIMNKFNGERLLYTSDRIYGIDLSQYQHGRGKKGRIHWDQLRITHLGKASKKNISGEVNYPVSFAYIKSTQGTTIRNRYYKGDYKQARKQGIACGSYHFFSSMSDPANQAFFFLKHSSFQKGDLPPVLDVEPSKKEIEKMGGPKEMFKRIRTWMYIVHKKVGIRPILYVNQIFVNKYLPLAPDIKRNYKVWIARYGEYKPEIKLIYWQLSYDGNVRGIRGNVDINVFNGYKDVFEEFLQNERIGM